MPTEIDERMPGLSFGELEATVAIMMHVAQHKRSTFISRLKQWQKMGFPEVPKVGRGARVRYRVEHSLQIAVMMQLLRLGLTPDRAINYVKGTWPQIRRGFIEAFELLAKDEEVLTYAIVSLNALAELEGRDEATPAPGVDIIRDAEFAGLWYGIDDDDEEGADEAEKIKNRGYSSAAWQEMFRMKLSCSILIELSLLCIGWILAITTVTGHGLEHFAPEFVEWREADRDWYEETGKFDNDHDFHVLERDTADGTWRSKVMPAMNVVVRGLIGADRARELREEIEQSPSADDESQAQKEI